MNQPSNRFCNVLLSALMMACIHAAPVKLIFDTDMGNDIDDAQALAMIHALQRRGAVELLAVTSTKDHPLSAAFIDAMNTFYGRPNLPIGAVRNGATPDEGKYLGIIHRKDQQGDFLYPHDLRSGVDAPDAVALLRKTLAAQPDGSVSIAQVGFFTNLVRLMDSKADPISPLSGKDLIRKKVKVLVIMAGAFDFAGQYKDHREYNVVKDIPAAKLLAKNWPGSVIWSGFEIGMALRYPASSIQQDYNYTAHHIVKESYLAYCGENGENPTWDLTCPLLIAFPDRGYFDLSETGEVIVAEDGYTSFKPKPDGRHRYMKMNTVQTARVREAFVQLCPEPPASLSKP